MAWPVWQLRSPPTGCCRHPVRASQHPPVARTLRFGRSGDVPAQHRTGRAKRVQLREPSPCTASNGTESPLNATGGGAARTHLAAIARRGPRRSSSGQLRTREPPRPLGRCVLAGTAFGARWARASTRLACGCSHVGRVGPNRSPPAEAASRERQRRLTGGRGADGMTTAVIVADEPCMTASVAPVARHMAKP